MTISPVHKIGQAAGASELLHFIVLCIHFLDRIFQKVIVIDVRKQQNHQCHHQRDQHEIVRHDKPQENQGSHQGEGDGYDQMDQTLVGEKADLGQMMASQSAFSGGSARSSSTCFR